MPDFRNRIIFTANPSFATPGETDFWQHFNRVCNREGWRLFKHSMRRIPADRDTMILPSRLTDVARFIPPFPASWHDPDLPPWLSRRDFRTIVEWEGLRWNIDGQQDLMAEGLVRLAWHVEHLYRRLRPAGTIVSNKIDHGTALFHFAAAHHGRPALFFERSPLETFILEEQGMFSESRIWDLYRHEVEQHGQRFGQSGQGRLEFLATNAYGFRPQKFPAEQAAMDRLAATRGPRFFLPMDNILWTGWAQPGHWQGVRDHYPGTPSPGDAIDRLAAIAASHGGTLIIKRHPSDVQVHHFTAPNVLVLDAPLERLIAACDLCICFLTKMAFVAPAMGRPTVTLGPNTAAASGATFHAERVEDWPGVIARALAATPADLARRRQDLGNLLGWLHERFYLQAQLPLDFSRPQAADILDRVMANGDRRHLIGTPSSLTHLIDDVQAEFADRPRWMQRQAGPADAPLVLLDVSRLANTRLHHSGISRFTRHLLDALRARDDVQVRPVLCKPQVLRRGAHMASLEDLGLLCGEEILLPDQLAAAAAGRRAVIFSPYDELLPMPGCDLPRVVTVHDVLHVTASEWYLAPDARAHVDNVLESIGPRDMVAVVSEFTRLQLLRTRGLAPDQVQAVHLGMAPVYRRASPQAIAGFRRAMNLGDAPYFVLFGQFEARKNMPSMLAALRRMAASPQSRAIFVIVASAVGHDALQAALDATGLPRDRLRVMSAPSDEDVALAYSGARGMLYVSLAEGFGLPALEAMACGCPIITSSVSSLPEVVGAAGLYVDPFRPEQILAAMQTLEEAQDLADRLSEAALRQASGFSWAATAEGVRILVEEALARHVPSGASDLSPEMALSLAGRRRRVIGLCGRLLGRSDEAELSRLQAEIEDLAETDPVRMHGENVLGHCRPLSG